MPRNPCREVRRYPAPPRGRYVADSEVEALRRHCSDRTNAYLDLKLSTGARQGQIFKVRWEHWDGSELYVAAAKGGKNTWYGGPGVRAALTACAAAFHAATLEEAAKLSSPVVVTRSGAAYRSAKGMICSLWHPAMRRYLDSNPGAERFREHDLRAKVASDSGDLTLAQERLGHQTNDVTQRVYMRKPRHVRSADIRRSQPDLFDSMGGPAVSPSRAPGGVRGLKRQGDESQDDSRKAAVAARSPEPRVARAELGLSAGPSATTTGDAPRTRSGRGIPSGRAGASPARSSPPGRMPRKAGDSRTKPARGTAARRR